MKTKQIQLSLKQLDQRFSNTMAWEERYRQLLLLAKQLHAMNAADKQAQYLVKGCESKVWLRIEQEQLTIDSDAKIIRGLLVIMLCCINCSASISEAKSQFDQQLQRWGLAQHLSDSRNDGISAIWQRLAKS